MFSSASCVSPTTFRDCVYRHTMATSTPAMMLDPHSRQADSVHESCIVHGRTDKALVEHDMSTLAGCHCLCASVTEATNDFSTSDKLNSCLQFHLHL